MASHPVYSLTSSYLALFLHLKWRHMINPWIIELDLNNETLSLIKRNWYFIGKDRTIISFRFIRMIQVDEHLVGCDVKVKAVGGTVDGRYFKKRHVRVLKEKLIEYNYSKNKKHIVFS